MADYLNIAGRVRTTASDGVAMEAQEVKDLNLNKSQQEINADVQTELGDRYTKEETYSKEQLDDLITTPDVDYVSVVATNATTAVTDVIPATGEANTIYRVGNWDGTQYDPTMYALFAWNGSAYVCLAVRSFVGEVYDISVNHPDGQGNPTLYADLAAALGANGANVPESLRKDGMSVKFIQGSAQSSDNKYVQYRLMSTAWSTDVTDWQGVDIKPVAGSRNLVESSGAREVIDSVVSHVLAPEGQIMTKKSVTLSANNNRKFLKTDGTMPDAGAGSSYRVVEYAVSENNLYVIFGRINNNNNCCLYVFYDSNGNVLSWGGKNTTSARNYTEVVLSPTGAVLLRVQGTSSFFPSVYVYSVVVKDSSETSTLRSTLDVPSIKFGKNLLDPSRFVGKYIDSDGSLVSSNLYVTTSYYIPVKAETNYYASADNDAVIYSSSDKRYIAFYDSNKNLLDPPTIENTKSFTTPQNCAYIKLCWLPSKNKLMLNEGTERGNYEEYSQIAGYPDKNEERIGNLETRQAASETNINTNTSNITTIKDYLWPYTRMTGFDIKSRWIAPEGDWSSAAYNHASIPVSAGEEYYLTAESGGTALRYGFLGSDNSDNGGTPDYVTGTTFGSVGSGKTVKITIPDGCNILVFNLLDNYYRIYHYAAWINEAIDKINNDINTLIGSITTINNNIDDINDNIYAYLESSEATVLTASNDTESVNYYYDGYALLNKSNGSVATSTRSYITAYVEIPDTGLTIKAYTPNETSKAAYCLYDENFGFIGFYRGTSAGSIATYKVIKEDNPDAKYIRWCGSNKVSNVSSFYTLTKVSEIDEINKKSQSIELCESLLGKDGLQLTKETFVSGESVIATNFPWYNRFGNQIALTAKISVFDKIKLYCGNGSYGYRYVVIDNTNISIHNSGQNALETVAHGLTFSSYISVNFNFLDNGKLRIQLMTRGGIMTKNNNNYYDFGWSYASGKIELVNDGSVLSEVQLSITNKNFRCPFWIFGASQEGFSSNRWIGQLVRLGYFNFLINSLSGRNSNGIINDLKRALRFGCPKYVYFALSNDGYAEGTYGARMDAAADLADEYGFDIIFVSKAVVPQEKTGDPTIEEQRNKRNYVINYVYNNKARRYFDFGKAVSSNPANLDANGDEVNDEYLGGLYVDSSGNYYLQEKNVQGVITGHVHPSSAEAARAIAMQFIADVPEVMQYNDTVNVTGDSDDAPDDEPVGNS